MVKKRKSQTLGKEKRETMQNIENVKFLAWPNVRNQVVVQKNSFSKKVFQKQLMLPLHTNLKMVQKDKKKLYEHVRIHPAISH